jgi:NAD(P)-dependent dehydrogenase (short-subunit alcohol dehydrogenase family)
MASRTWLITRVSSGFGRKLTQQLLDHGDRVVATVRDTSKVTGPGRQAPGHLHRRSARDDRRRSRPAFGNQQTCIDVLCGYLRMPYEPDRANRLPRRSGLPSVSTGKSAPP